ncbi:hypothetical protein [Thermocrispum municipale]|uniref:hypothetical protein n=1 Tax=Thermocrispum municipale TaxID=37926 RepID=UPI0012EB2BA1|nr:hypothetical protein [Thermocrispum municipale]
MTSPSSTNTEPKKIRSPTLLRPALHVEDPAGVQWQVEHRISPWRRRIQPISLVWFTPRRYSEVGPTSPAPTPLKKNGGSKEAGDTADKPKEALDEFTWKLIPYGLLFIVLWVLGFAYSLFLIALTVLEMVIRLAVALMFSVLLGCEVLIQWIVGAIQRLQSGKQGRVDVLRTLPENGRIAALTVVMTPTEDDARRLAQTLATQLTHHAPVTVSRDPDMQSLVISHKGRIADEKMVHLGGIPDTMTLVDRIDPGGFRWQMLGHFLGH